MLFHISRHSKNDGPLCAVWTCSGFWVCELHVLYAQLRVVWSGVALLTLYSVWCMSVGWRLLRFCTLEGRPQMQLRVVLWLLFCRSLSPSSSPHHFFAAFVLCCAVFLDCSRARLLSTLTRSSCKFLICAIERFSCVPSQRAKNMLRAFFFVPRVGVQTNIPYAWAGSSCFFQFPETHQFALSVLVLAERPSSPDAAFITTPPICTTFQCKSYGRSTPCGLAKPSTPPVDMCS